MIAETEHITQATKPTVERLTYTVEEAAGAIGCGRTSVFRLLREGKLRSIRVGSRRLIPREEIDRFIASSMG